MRDLLGVSNDLEGLGQSAWIGRLEAHVGEVGLGRQAALHDLVRRSSLEHALASSGIVNLTGFALF
jgi:hypothetical protein